MKIAIIGVGLIGSSFAIKLKECGIADKLFGVDNNSENVNCALKLGYFDSELSLNEACKEADLIVISTPVDSIPAIAEDVLNKINKQQIVIDMGSLKEDLCTKIIGHKNRGRMVAAHPMWGTEHSGPQAATNDSFTGRTVVICEKESSDIDAVLKVENIFTKIGMTLRYMNAEQHDLHAAYVSHISHITSFALALSVLEKERETETIFDLAAAGFESTVRLAKSSPDTWTPIFIQNKFNVLEVLNENIHQLNILKKMIERGDEQGLRTMIEKANEIKKILK